MESTEKEEPIQISLPFDLPLQIPQESVVIKFDQFSNILQTTGYSIFFWINLPTVKCKTSALLTLSRKSSLTPLYQLFIHKEQLKYKISNGEKYDEITITKTLVPQKFMHICITFDSLDNLLTTTTYIDSILLSEKIMQCSDPISTECDIIFGNNKFLPSVENGLYADGFMIYRVARNEEIVRYYNECDTMQTFNAPNISYKASNAMFERIRTEDKLAEFIKDKSLPYYITEDLGVDYHAIHEEIKGTDNNNTQENDAPFEKARDTITDQNAILSDFLRKYQYLEDQFVKLSNLHNFIFNTCSIIACNAIDKSCKVEISRVVNVLKELDIGIDEGAIKYLSTKFGQYYLEEKVEYVMIYDFIVSIFCRYNNISQFGIEPLKSSPDKSKEEDKDNEKSRDNVSLEISNLKLSPKWNEGEIEIYVSRCFDCRLHETYSRHNEYDFIDCFNRLGEEIKKIFPYAKLIGNHMKPASLGEFNVYMYGAKSHKNGIKMLFQKGKMEIFPEAKEIIDKIIFRVAASGYDTFILAKAQNIFKEEHKDLYGKPWSKAHEHPFPCPEDIKPTEIKKKERVFDEDKLICAHYGCGTIFTRDKNEKTSCTYHPGKYEFGSINGLWPEGWTCCRKSWTSPGCGKGKHVGTTEEKQIFLCINHGEINPKTGYPDSFCGKPFTKKNTDGCSLHSGYIVNYGSEKKWSCCKGSANKEGECEPCKSDSHKNAVYPEEECKLYFFDMPVQNPGVNRTQQSAIALFAKYGKYSGFFRKTKEYLTLTKKKLTKDEQDKIDNSNRLCLNWGCIAVYKQSDNNPKACQYHPGAWDFGHTGSTIKDLCMSNLSSMPPPLWKPHWTCCRNDWTHKGCKKGFHKGPLESSLAPNFRKYKFPDERAQIYFAKKVSESWTKKLESTNAFDKEKVLKIYEYFEKQIYFGAIPLDKITNVMQKLKFPTLVSSPDLAFQFKYRDVIEGRLFQILDNGSGAVDKAKFMKWWFSTLEEEINDRAKAATESA